MDKSLTKRSYENDGISNVKKKEKSTSSFQYLTYDVLRIIFKYLNGRNLKNASKVCRSWLEAANDEKRTRTGVTCYLVQNFKNTQEFSELCNEKVWIDPTVGLLFGPPTFNAEPVPDNFCQNFSMDCRVISLTAFGTVFNNNESETECSKNLICAFLPEISGVTIKIFPIFEKSHHTLEQFEEIKQLVGSFDKSRPGSQCLILLSSRRKRNVAQKITRLLNQHAKQEHISVWGGVVETLKICNYDLECSRSVSCIGITLAGAFDSWTVLIDCSYKTKEAVEQKLKSFQSTVTLRKHSIGFMFVCYGRGADLYEEYNVESTIFKQLFPETPLVGCFGDGEFGRAEVQEEYMKKNPWYHENSTSILIITYG